MLPLYLKALPSLRFSGSNELWDVNIAFGNPELVNYTADGSLGFGGYGATFTHVGAGLTDSSNFSNLKFENVMDGIAFIVNHFSANTATDINTYLGVSLYAYDSFSLSDGGTKAALDQKQPSSVMLTALSSVTPTANTFLYFDGTPTAQSTSITPAIRTLMAQTTNAAIASTMGLSTVATTGAYPDLTSKPTIPTATSQLTNDSGFVGASGLSAYVTKTTTVNGHALSGNVTVTASDLSLATVATSGSYSDLTSKPTIPTVVSALTNDAGYLTSASVAGTYVAKTVTVNGHALSGNVTVTSSDLSLATVATSGSYPDLINKPTIPSVARTISTLTLAMVGTGATGTQISSTKDSTVYCTVSTSATATIAGAATSTITLKICATNDATEANWTSVAVSETSQSYSLAVALQGVTGGKGQLCAEVPTGYYVKLVNTGSGTHAETFVSGQKIIYG